MTIGFVIVWFHTAEDEKRRLRKEIKSLGLPEYSVHEIDNTEDNVGFAAGVNRGIKEALRSGVDVVCLLNPDVSFTNAKAWIPVSSRDLPAGRQGMTSPSGFAITGGVMEQGGIKYYGGVIDKRRMSGGLRRLGPHLRGGDSVGIRDDDAIDFVSGSLMFIKREVFEKIGYLDESYFMYYEDVEFCQRAKRAGFAIGIDPRIEYIHFESSDEHPRKRFWLARNRLKFALSYGGFKQILWEIVYLPKTLPELFFSFTKSSPFTQNILSLNVSSILTKVLSFVLFYFLIRTLSPADYGIWVLAWAHSSILNPILDFGTTTYGLTHYDHDGKGIGHVLQLRTFLSILVLCATIGLAFLLGYTSSTLPLILLITLTTITNSVSGSFLIWNSVQGRARVSALYGFLFELLLSGSLIGMLTSKYWIPAFAGMTGGSGMTGWGAGMTEGGIGMTILLGLLAVILNLGYAGVLLHKMSRNGVDFFHWKWGSWKPILNHSLVFALIAFFAGLYYRIDIFLLNKLRGAGELAVYSAGYKFFDASLLLAASYNISAAPVLAKLAHEDRNVFLKKIRKDLGFLGILGIVGVIGCWILSPFLKYAGLVGPFAPSIDLLKILIFALPCILVSSIFLNVLYVLKKMWWVVFVFIGMVVWNGVLNYVLIPQYGAFASAYITVSTEIFNVLILGGMMVYALHRGSTNQLAVDGGALCAPSDKRFGTYSVSAGIIQELANTEDRWVVYGFNNRLLESVDRKQARILKPSFAWQKWRVPLEQLLHTTDWYFALNQSIPSYISGKVVSLSHGLSFMKYPELYPDSYEKLTRQVEEMVKRSEVILVSSIRVKEEFDELFPGHGRIEVIPFGVSLSSSGKERSDDEPGIHALDGPHLDSRLRGNDSLAHGNDRGVWDDSLPPQYDSSYVLAVGMAHPIKNHAETIRIVEKIRKVHSEYSLIIVGAGEKQPKDPKWLIRIPHANEKELATLYANASCLLTTSLYESFNFPVLESLSHGTPVVGYQSTIIPELEKYVKVVGSVDEAAEVIVKKDFIKVPNQEELEKKFSWGRFVKKLHVILGRRPGDPV